MRGIRLALIGILVVGVITTLAWALVAHRNREARHSVAIWQAGIARRDADAKAFQAVWAKYKGGSLDYDPVYHASLRFRDAERDLSDRRADRVKAARAHLDRMIRLLEGEGRRQFELGSKPFELEQAQSYRLEAEYWLARTKLDP